MRILLEPHEFVTFPTDHTVVLSRSDIASYDPDDVYKPRQGVDGVKGREPQP